MPAFKAESAELAGTVKNTTVRLLRAVRIDVSLSSGKRLGPTAAMNLLPGEEVPVKLSATSEKFTWWTPHTERDRD